MMSQPKRDAHCWWQAHTGGSRAKCRVRLTAILDLGCRFIVRRAGLEFAIARLVWRLGLICPIGHDPWLPRGGLMSKLFGDPPWSACRHSSDLQDKTIDRLSMFVSGWQSPSKARFAFFAFFSTAHGFGQNHTCVGANIRALFLREGVVRFGPRQLHPMRASG